uniref:Uncharacterized protein n=1 Tax=Callorhinchus milii TaxID=7868 RepID=A0A4W3HD01_CALMI
MMRILFALAVLSIFLKTSHGNWEESVQQPGNGWDLDRVSVLGPHPARGGGLYRGELLLRVRAALRNMHDFFVGLMGRRNVEYGENKAFAFNICSSTGSASNACFVGETRQPIVHGSVPQTAAD